MFLIKDLNIEHVFIDRKYNNKHIITMDVLITASVIIKRDGKFYAVPFKQRYEKNVLAAGDIIEDIQQSVTAMERMSEFWRIAEGDFKDLNDNRVLMQKEITL